MPFGSHHRRMGGTHRHKSQGHPTHKPPVVHHGGSALDQQLWDYFIVVDFEATCEENVDDYPHEIIEFPAVVIDVAKGTIDRERAFRTYVKPTRNPKLSHFCTALTGITQKLVDDAPTLQEAVRRFESWYRRTIPSGAKAVIATDGPWDMRDFVLKHAVQRDGVSFPSLFYEYIDVRETCTRFFGKGKGKSLMGMMRSLGLSFDGRPHSGLDDAYNIARLMVAMMKKGCKFHFLVALPLSDEHHYTMDVCPPYRLSGGSGLVHKTHVDEIAKKTFGQAFFNYGTALAEVEGGGSELRHSHRTEPYRSLWGIAVVILAIAILANTVMRGGVSVW